MLVIKYGTKDKSIDVTQICMSRCCTQNIIYIPSSDHKRAEIFSDPIFGVVKNILISRTETELCQFGPQVPIYIDLQNLQIYTNNVPNEIKNNFIEPENKLLAIHQKLKFQGGNHKDEWPEQLMVVKFLSPDSKVLEIGGNIGRNTLVIASILNHSNFVVLESNPEYVPGLTLNRDTNNFKFHIEGSALSLRKLVQKGWTTLNLDTVPPGYMEIKTISWTELNQKYQIEFDTLVLDCEGAFYYILLDMPQILTHIKLIIMENDYSDIKHKQYINTTLTQNNFKVIYQQAGGWGPCYPNFYEVWSK